MTEETFSHNWYLVQLYHKSDFALRYRGFGYLSLNKHSYLRSASLVKHFFSSWRKVKRQIFASSSTTATQSKWKPKSEGKETPFMHLFSKFKEILMNIL